MDVELFQDISKLTKKQKLIFLLWQIVFSHLGLLIFPHRNM